MDRRHLQPPDEDGIDLAHEPLFVLGPLHVSPSTREVRSKQRCEIVEPRVAQVLVCLVQAAGAVVSRDDLIRRCWGGRVVGEDAINRCIAKVRQIADLDEAPSFVIETIPRVGYRLRNLTEAGPAIDRTVAPDAEPVPNDAPLVRGPTYAERPPPQNRGRRRLIAVSAAAALVLVIVGLSAWALHQPAPPVPMRSVAVLPIVNLTGDPTLDATTDKLTEDIIQVLARGANYVTPRNAAFAWKGKLVDERAVGAALKVRHVATASLRKADSGYRVSLQIVDTLSGRTILSEDLGGGTSDAAEAERQFALKLFEEIAQTVDDRWRAEILARPADDSDPESVLVRFDALADTGRREDIPKVEHLIAIGRTLLPKQGEIGEEFLGSVCWYYYSLLDHRYETSPGQRAVWAAAALDAATQASRAKSNTTWPHGCRAQVFAALERWDEGLAEARYIVDKFPLTAVGYESLARLDMGRGAFRDALADLTAFAARMPGRECLGDASDGGCRGALGFVDLCLGDYQAAITQLRELAVLAPQNPWTPFFLSAALELSGAHADAVSSAQAYARLKTDDRIWRYLSLSHEPNFVAQVRIVRDALRNAGLDEPARDASE